MSDTPRTDAASWREHQQSVVDADFARELERELAKAIAERDEARRSACTFKALYMDSRIGFSRMRDAEANTEARKIAARMRWDCFKEEVEP